MFSVGGKKCDRLGTVMVVNYSAVLRGRPGDQICFLRPEGTNLAWKQFRAIWLFICVWISMSFFPRVVGRVQNWGGGVVGYK